MKNLVVEKLNNFIDIEIDNLCNDYERKIKELEEQNEKLSQKLEEQLLAVKSNNTQNIIPNEAHKTLEQVSALREERTNEDIIVKFIDILNMNTLSVSHFPYVIEHLNTILLESNDNVTIKSILKAYIEITNKKKQRLLKQAFSENDYKLTKHLLSSPVCCIEKLQLFSEFKLTTLVKQFIEKLLTVHVSFVKDTHSPEQLAHLFWYAFLFDYQSLFLKNFNDVVTKTNPLTAIYFKRVRPKDEKIFTNELRKLLTQHNVFNEAEYGGIKNKLLRKNLINSSVLNKQNQEQLDYPFIHALYVTKETDISTFIQNFSLKRATILINLVDSSSKNLQKTIEAFVDSKQTKAYITDKQYATYLDQFSPFRPKISDYYYNFKWPSTEIINDSTAESTPLQKVSELQALGYSYNLNQKKRWEILCNAVKKLGLKKVAYTLASNTKRLKGRKPDSLAISIWESDLTKLKQKFYTNSFQWPSTKL